MKSLIQHFAFNCNKYNGLRKTLQKRSLTLKSAWLPLQFMLWNGSGKPIQLTSLTNFITSLVYLTTPYLLLSTFHHCRHQPPTQRRNRWALSFDASMLAVVSLILVLTNTFLLRHFVTFYVLYLNNFTFNQHDYCLFNTWLVSGCEQKVFSLYFSWTRGRLSETLKALLQWFCY